MIHETLGCPPSTPPDMSLKECWNRLKNGETGTRFRDFYVFRKRRRSRGVTVWRIVKVSIAFALIVGGLLIGWLPGPGGFIALIGIGILVQEFRWVAKICDGVEKVLMPCWKWLRRRHAAVQTGLVAIAIGITAGGIYAGYVVVS